MAKQFLNGAQIAPCIKQMGCKAVPQRVRCSAWGQAKLHPRFLNNQCNDARVQRAAANAAKKRRIGCQFIRAQVGIARQCVACSGQDGQFAFLIALAAHP